MKKNLEMEKEREKGERMGKRKWRESVEMERERENGV